jgi:hypothetical protein
MFTAIVELYVLKQTKLSMDTKFCHEPPVPRCKSNKSTKSNFHLTIIAAVGDNKVIITWQSKHGHTLDTLHDVNVVLL